MERIQIRLTGKRLGNCIASLKTLRWSPIFANLHFLERVTTENFSWSTEWFWLLPLTCEDSPEAWIFLLDHATADSLCLVTLLNWTAGILTMKIGITPKNYF